MKKLYQKHKFLGLILSGLNQDEASALGHLNGRTADFSLTDTHRRIKTIIALRAFARALEEVIMAGMDDKTREELNAFNKEV